VLNFKWLVYIVIIFSSPSCFVCECTQKSDDTKLYDTWEELSTVKDSLVQVIGTFSGDQFGRHWLTIEDTLGPSFLLMYNHYPNDLHYRGKDVFKNGRSSRKGQYGDQRIKALEETKVIITAKLLSRKDQYARGYRSLPSYSLWDISCIKRYRNKHK